VVGTLQIVGTPLWVLAHVGVISELITGAEEFGLRAADGGQGLGIADDRERAGHKQAA
jgi:hypothetical protein